MSRLTVAFLAVFVASELNACSCVPQNIEQAFKNADMVFAGAVVSVEDGTPRENGNDSWDSERGRKVTFRVMQWWKTDTLAASVDLWTGFGGGDCGYPVEAGKSYLVYARRDLRNRLTFSICGRSAALICSREDLEALGEPIKTYETFDTPSLIEREQPYTTYWRPCIEGPVLLGERGLKMDKHCRFTVEGVIGTDGTVRNFRIISASVPKRCPASRTVADRVAAWRFRPAELEGKPIETQLTAVSMREPVDEAAYARFLKERAEWEARKKPE